MTLQLKAEKREIFGKKLKSARKDGKMPAVVYGKGKATESIFVALKDFKKVWKEAGESTIIELQEKSPKKPENVIIKEVAIDPVSDEPLHVDFFKIEMDKPIRVSIPLVFEGLAPAVKELGGVLVKILHEIEIEALPKDLPSEIKIDISKLKTLEDRITIGDLNIPNNIKIDTKADEIVALIEEPQKEEVIEERKIEDIEVEKKGKEKEEEGVEEEKEKGEKKKEEREKQK